ncbi:hypothetical protein Tco_1556856 [Tanacetum coccineum]
MVEPENPLKKKDQITHDEELALRMHAEELAKLERMQKERVNSFVPMDSEVVKSSVTRIEGSSKRAGDELESDQSKNMRMEQYLTHTDYALWEVIVNGDAPAVASASAEGPIPPKTAEQKLARKNELKAKKHYIVGHSG